MGAVIIPLIGLYLFLLVWATRRGWRWAVERGWQGRKRWLGAAYGFLIVCLPVFWDWIPTVVAHHYYCSTEAGFWVYKTPEQWKTENPGVAKGLVATPSKSENLDHEWTRYWINQRLYFDVKQERNFKHAIWREEKRLVDVNTQQVLAKVISFSQGVSGNVLAMGGTLDEFRQALVLGWGERDCTSDRQPLTDRFAINIHSYTH